MGRRKIDIVRIENERHRQVTFTKRKSGLIKKATELAILCDAQVGIVIFGSNQKMSLYSSCQMDELLARYHKHKEMPEITTTDDYFRDRQRKAGSGGGGGGDGSDDDDDDAAISNVHAIAYRGAADAANTLAPQQQPAQQQLPCATAICQGANGGSAAGGSYMCLGAPGGMSGGGGAALGVQTSLAPGMSVVPMGGGMGHPQQGMPQQGMPQQGMPQQGMPQQGTGGGMGGMPQQHGGLPQPGIGGMGGMVGMQGVPSHSGAALMQAAMPGMPPGMGMGMGGMGGPGGMVGSPAAGCGGQQACSPTMCGMYMAGAGAGAAPPAPAPAPTAPPASAAASTNRKGLSIFAPQRTRVDGEGPHTAAARGAMAPPASSGPHSGLGLHGRMPTPGSYMLLPSAGGTPTSPGAFIDGLMRQPNSPMIAGMGGMVAGAMAKGANGVPPGLGAGAVAPHPSAGGAMGGGVMRCACAPNGQQVMHYAMHSASPLTSPLVDAGTLFAEHDGSTPLGAMMHGMGAMHGGQVVMQGGMPPGMVHGHGGILMQPGLPQGMTQAQQQQQQQQQQQKQRHAEGWGGAPPAEMHGDGSWHHRRSGKRPERPE